MKNASYRSRPSGLLVLVRERDERQVMDEIDGRSRQGWEGEIEVRIISEKNKLSKMDGARTTEENTRKITSDYSADKIDKIIAFEHLAVHRRDIEECGIRARWVSSVATLLKEIDDELKLRKLHWLGHALAEWEKSSIRCLRPEAWVQQFAELGYKDVAKRLLQNLRVITHGDMTKSFQLSSRHEIGYRVVHAYVLDDEAGSSSNAVKNILEHMYPAESVRAIDLSKLDSFCFEDIDQLFIYEDGLWSGVELVERLEKIGNATVFNSAKMQIHFRYCATSDVGLLTGRLYATKKGLPNVQIHPAHQEYYFYFLREGAVNSVETMRGMDHNAIRKALDELVEPFAFRSEQLWGDTRSDAISVCVGIGAQLVRPFLERRALAKKNQNDGDGSIEISADKLNKWALGALNFASTIVFESSIPKPVLPLMWLDGQVEVANKKVSWRPLFWDVRRTGSVDPNM